MGCGALGRNKKSVRGMMTSSLLSPLVLQPTVVDRLFGFLSTDAPNANSLDSIVHWVDRNRVADLLGTVESILWRLPSATEPWREVQLTRAAVANLQAMVQFRESCTFLSGWRTGPVDGIASGLLRSIVRLREMLVARAVPSTPRAGALGCP